MWLPNKLSDNSLSWRSLHWLILDFLYAFFVQWSMLATTLSSYPITPPPTHISSAQTILLYTQTQYLIKIVFFAQRERVKLLSRPKKYYFLSPLYCFLLTMTSQIESTSRPNILHGTKTNNLSAKYVNYLWTGLVKKQEINLFCQWDKASNVALCS